MGDQGAGNNLKEVQRNWSEGARYLSVQVDALGPRSTSIFQLQQLCD